MKIIIFSLLNFLISIPFLKSQISCNSQYLCVLPYLNVNPCNVDIDFDGITDFRFRLIVNSPSFPDYNFYVEGVGENKIYIEDSVSYYSDNNYIFRAKNFLMNQTIGNNIAKSTAYLSYTHPIIGIPDGYFMANNPIIPEIPQQYLGVRLVKNSEVYNAWIKISLDFIEIQGTPSLDAKIEGYCYSLNPFETINAGNELSTFLHNIETFTNITFDDFNFYITSHTENLFESFDKVDVYSIHGLRLFTTTIDMGYNKLEIPKNSISNNSIIVFTLSKKGQIKKTFKLIHKI